MNFTTNVPQESRSRDALTIAKMFPNVATEDIENDLNMTHSLEATVNNILDGSVCSQNDPDDNMDAFKTTESDGELPDLDENKPSLPPAHSVRSDFISDSSDIESEPVAKQNIQGHSVLPTVVCVDSDDDIDNTVGLLSRIKQKSSFLTQQQCFKKSTKGFSCADSSDVELKRTASSSHSSDKGNSYTSKKEVIGVVGVTVQEPARKRRKSEMEPRGEQQQSKRSDKEAERQRKKQEQEAAKKRKEEEKLKREQERQQKKMEQEYERAKKKTMQEMQRSAKPGECLKHVTVMLDPGVLKYPGGGAILGLIENSDLKYDIQPQVFPNIVTFWREVTEVKEVAPHKLETHNKEVVEDQILLFLPVSDFVPMVFTYQQKKQGVDYSDNDTLTSYVTKIRRKLENRKVTLLVNGMNKYFRDQKNKEQRAYRDNVLAVGSATTETSGGRKKKQGADAVIVSRMDVEEALIDVQLQTGTNIRLLDSDKDVGSSVMQYAKAVAETPFKKGRMECGFSFHIESSGCVKVDKDGQGLTKVWRKQLQQFKNVTAEVANAIMAVYPSPSALWKAYDNCPSDRDAELLLQDIVVRRGAGVLATARRIGKELSRRLWQYMTATDPTTVLR